jgi:hypothetical protein
MSEVVTAEITAENTFTDPLFITSKPFSLSISGTFSATWTLQRSHDGGANWNDVVSDTVADELSGNEPIGALYRIGVKTGNFTSGTVVVRMAQ